MCTLGCWTFPTFKLHAEKIQSDPFAPPSLFRVIMDQEVARYPEFTNRYICNKKSNFNVHVSCVICNKDLVTKIETMAKSVV